MSPRGAIVSLTGGRAPGDAIASSDALAVFERAVAFEFGAPVTGPQGKLAAQAEAVRDRVAIFANGLTFVLDTHATDNGVMSVMGLARMASIQLRLPIVVDMDRIRRLNAVQRAPQQTGRAEVNDDLLAPERSIIERFRRALAERASDIHISIEGGVGSIEYRIDGVLVPVEEASPADLQRFIRAAFTMADTRDANFVDTLPQTGRIASGDRIQLPEGLETVRMQYAPTPSGSVLALRLLHSWGDRGEAGLRSLGYAAEQIEILDVLTDRTSGAVVVAGKMNSGKSTTTKNALEWIIDKTGGGRRVMTIEDPVELRIAGAKQTSITDARTTDERTERFAQQIRTTLRMDANVIMVGEIRDKVVADAALEVAITGHAIWTTLHTYSAFGIVTRLLDLGLEAYKVGNAHHISGLICQSLVRQLCRSCAIPLSDPKAPIKPHLRRDLEQLGASVDIGNIRIGHTPGCQRCRRGFKGRTLVAEVVRTDAEIMSHVRGGQVAQAEKAWMDGGHPTMFEHAMTKVLAGEICPVEIAQAIGDARLSGARAEILARVGT